MIYPASYYVAKMKTAVEAAGVDWKEAVSDHMPAGKCGHYTQEMQLDAEPVIVFDTQMMIGVTDGGALVCTCGKTRYRTTAGNTRYYYSPKGRSGCPVARLVARNHKKDVWIDMCKEVKVPLAVHINKKVWDNRAVNLRVSTRKREARTEEGRAMSKARGKKTGARKGFKIVGTHPTLPVGEWTSHRHVAQALGIPATRIDLYMKTPTGTLNGWTFAYKIPSFKTRADAAQRCTEPRWAHLGRLLPKIDRYPDLLLFGKGYYSAAGANYVAPAKGSTNSTGYYIATVYQKNLEIHRLIAEAAHPKEMAAAIAEAERIGSTAEVDHVDEIPEHNEEGNLKWCTKLAHSRKSAAFANDVKSRMPNPPKSRVARGHVKPKEARGEAVVGVHSVHGREEWANAGTAAKDDIITFSKTIIVRCLKSNRPYDGWKFTYARPDFYTLESALELVERDEYKHFGEPRQIPEYPTFTIFSGGYVAVKSFKHRLPTIGTNRRSTTRVTPNPTVVYKGRDVFVVKLVNKAFGKRKREAGGDNPAAKRARPSSDAMGTDE